MTVSEVEALGAHVAKQGVRVTRTKSGLLFRLPNQDTVMVHYTSSDVNQVHQIRRELKRAGILMPKEAKSVTKHPTKKTRQLVKGILDELGDPNEVTVKEIRDICLSRGLSTASGTISGVLGAMGYSPSGSTSSRVYHRPQKVAMKLPEEIEEEVQQQRELVAAKPHVEFVDTVGSWMVDPETLPQSLTIEAAAQLLAKVGLGMQIRVWRLPEGPHK
jgi:hypothetical protein